MVLDFPFYWQFFFLLKLGKENDRLTRTYRKLAKLPFGLETHLKVVSVISFAKKQTKKTI